MLAILSKIFGLKHIDLIEDAIQDTFLQAALKWRNNIPENPEAWLTQAAKNRIIDLLRQIKAKENREKEFIHGAVSIDINEFFLEHEVEDSLLRMLFVACNPEFSQEEQITFALKSISGFSRKEIAAALLQNEETIKKRLTRAKAKIIEKNIKMEYPGADEIKNRLAGVMQIIYLIFNEGFHSTKEDSLVDKELCGEALRLIRFLLTKEGFRSGSMYALFALMCFNSSRLEAKIVDGEIIDLKNQDRSKWYLPMIILGNDALDKAIDYEDMSVYHYEALIAAEHIRAIRFEDTNWGRIIQYYERIEEYMPNANVGLSKALVYIQMKKFDEAKNELNKINVKELNQRKYLYHGTMSEYFMELADFKSALNEINIAIELCNNKLELNYLSKKKKKIEENI